MFDKTGIRSDSKIITFNKSYKIQEIVKGHDFPCPEETKHLKEEVVEE